MKIIVNADDFGLNTACSEATAEAFLRRIISDTTMLANGDAFKAALSLARENGFDKKIGIHFNITEGNPLTEDIKDCPFFAEGGSFHGKIKRLKPLSRKEKNALYTELTAQVIKLKANGVSITHADSHHHIHTGFFIFPVVSRVCRENGINKIRLHRNVGKIPAYKRIVKKKFNKMLQKKGFTTTGFFGSLEDIAFKNIPGSLEVMVHPDYDINGNLIDRTGYDEKSGCAAGRPLTEISGDAEMTCFGDI